VGLQAFALCLGGRHTVEARVFSCWCLEEEDGWREVYGGWSYRCLQTQIRTIGVFSSGDCLEGGLQWEWWLELLRGFQLQLKLWPELLDAGVVIA
jgi:hypothetical protein